MFDLKSFFSFNQGDDIETDRQFQIEITDIGIRRSHDTPDLFIIDSFLRRQEIIFRTGFHLNDNQFLIFRRNNIQFIMMPPPVGMQNRVALPDQIVTCFRFTIPA